MDLFPLLHDWKYDAVCSPLITSKGGPHFLVSSPHGASTLTTSAPKSAKF